MNYTLDLNTGLTQVLSDGTNTYLYPSTPLRAGGNGRISQTNSTTEYFLGDALDSVRQLTDTNSAVTLTQSYAPYGEETQSIGTSQSPYAFTGEIRDANGLTYLRARYYNPADGRFLSRDTWHGDYNRPLSLNRWGYVEGNPVILVDPTGHNPWWCAYSSNPTKCVDDWNKNKDRIWDEYLRKCPETEPTVSVIFVCGFGVGVCRTHHYSGKRVFGEVDLWAKNNNYERYFYQAGQGQKKTVANRIFNPSCYQRWLMETAKTKRATFSSKPLAVTA